MYLLGKESRNKGVNRLRIGNIFDSLRSFDIQENPRRGRTVFQTQESLLIEGNVETQPFKEIVEKDIP